MKLHPQRHALSNPARDCADRSMRAAGRTEWSMDDFAAGVREFERLYGPPQWADSIIQPTEVA